MLADQYGTNKDNRERRNSIAKTERENDTTRDVMYLRLQYSESLKIVKSKSKLSILSSRFLSAIRGLRVSVTPIFGINRNVTSFIKYPKAPFLFHASSKDKSGSK